MSALMKAVPMSIQQVVNEAFIQVQQDTSHELPLFLRRQIYDAFLAFPAGKRAVAWLEILTVRFVLPLWEEEKLGMSWADYPTPHQLVNIQADKLRGIPIAEVDTQATSLADEMVFITGEDERSPIYPIWCVFEAAVRLNWSQNFNPGEQVTDTDVIRTASGKFDVAHAALVAYAGRIQTEIDDLSERMAIWEENEFGAERSSPLPWTLTLDAAACLEFWEWWLLKAIPEAWQWAVENPKLADDDN